MGRGDKKIEELFRDEKEMKEKSDECWKYDYDLNYLEKNSKKRKRSRV